jgi:hypothetical protein
LQNILINIFIAFLALATILYLLPRSSASILKYQRLLRHPIHVIVDILNAITFVSFDQINKFTVSSPLNPEYFALEGFVAHLIWPMCYPILAALPLAVAMPLQLVIGSIYISNNKNMCRNGLKMYPQTTQLYSTVQKYLSRVATSIPFSAYSIEFIDKKVLHDEALCSNILLFLEIIMVVVVLCYLLFISELSDRQIYCATAGKRELQGELRRRRPYAWQLLGEAILAWILLWNVVTLISDEWNFSF